MNSLARMLEFTQQLQDKKIHYFLDSYRPGAAMVRVDVPGERWEVEFFADGNVEIEVFRSTGEIEDASALQRLFTEYAD